MSPARPGLLFSESKARECDWASASLGIRAGHRLKRLNVKGLKYKAKEDLLLVSASIEIMNHNWASHPGFGRPQAKSHYSSAEEVEKRPLEQNVWTTKVLGFPRGLKSKFPSLLFKPIFSWACLWFYPCSPEHLLLSLPSHLSKFQ